MREAKVLVASIIRNFEPWADRFLDSIRTLNNSNLDVCYLLIEGNSTDRTYHILRKWVDSCNDGNAALVKHDLPEEMRVVDRVMASIELIVDIADSIVDYIMLIDSDIIEIPNNTLKTLIANIKRYNADIIAPYVFIVGIDHFYDTHVFRKNNKEFDASPPYAPDHKAYNAPFEVDSAGTCLLFKSNIFVDVVMENKKYRRAYQERGVDGYIGLCNTARKMGYRILADPTVRICHVNLNEYGIPWHRAEDW